MASKKGTPDLPRSKSPGPSRREDDSDNTPSPASAPDTEPSSADDAARPARPAVATKTAAAPSPPMPPPRPPRREVLIATLGFAPSVVTSALDLMLADGRVIDEVCIIHTSPEALPPKPASGDLASGEPAAESGDPPSDVPSISSSAPDLAQTPAPAPDLASTPAPAPDPAHPPAQSIRASLRRLREVFVGDSIYRHPKYERPCVVHWVALEHADGPIEDIRSIVDAQAVFRAIYSTVQRYKNEGALVHLSIAGGRKAIGAYGMAVAQLLFDANDRLWHVHSTQDFIDSRRLHPRLRHDASLVPIPVLSLGLAYAGPMAALLTTDDPVAAIEEQTRRLDAAAADRCRTFLDRVLTPQERRLVLCFLRAAVSESQAPSSDYLARSLTLTEGAIRKRLSEIYDKMRDHFDLHSAPIDSRVLVGIFAPHLDLVAD